MSFQINRGTDAPISLKYGEPYLQVDGLGSVLDLYFSSQLEVPESITSLIGSGTVTEVSSLTTDQLTVSTGLEDDVYFKYNGSRIQEQDIIYTSGTNFEFGDVSFFVESLSTSEVVTASIYVAYKIKQYPFLSIGECKTNVTMIGG